DLRSIQIGAPWRAGHAHRARHQPACLHPGRVRPAAGGARQGAPVRHPAQRLQPRLRPFRRPEQRARRQPAHRGHRAATRRAATRRAAGGRSACGQWHRRTRAPRSRRSRLSV
ncbi:MAG: hypothetical protein AVDCRST_MAG77-2003, partial [uncultured Chloroflexi bacterium]